MANMTPNVKARRRQELIDRDGSYCYMCGKHLRFQEVTLDHVVAKKDGGGNQINNLKVACYTCNHRRHNNI